MTRHTPTKAKLIMKVLSVIILLITSLSLSAQEYRIIKVAGNISDCANNLSLKRGDKIQANQRLCFVNTATRFAIASVINMQTGSRHVLKARSSTAGTQSGRVRDCIGRSRALTGSRQGKINTIFDLRTFLGSDDFLILGGGLALDINTKNIPMDDENFFFGSYTFRGETINKKLHFQDTLLSLSASELYKVDEVPICIEETSDFSLKYMNKEAGAPELVCSFTPVFPLSGDIKGELSIIQEAMGSTISASDLKEKMVAYLIDIYGKADKANIDKWMEKNLDLDSSKK